MHTVGWSSECFSPNISTLVSFIFLIFHLTIIVHVRGPRIVRNLIFESVNAKLIYAWINGKVV